jgi:hypothetical protein
MTGLREVCELADVAPAPSLGPVGDDVESQADRVLAVPRVSGIGGIAVGDEDVEVALHPPDVAEQATVDLLPGKARDPDEAPAVDRLAQVGADLLASHRRRGRRGHDERSQREGEGRPNAEPTRPVAPTCH